MKVDALRFVDQSRSDSRDIEDSKLDIAASRGVQWQIDIVEPLKVEKSW